jgi:soluble P-type ATPase
MIELAIPGFGDLKLRHLVLDYNGTLSCDGVLLDGVREALASLAEHVQIHVLTADTFGSAAASLAGLPCTLKVLPAADQAQAKAEYVRALGAGGCAAVGNGRNDRLMLKESALGMAVVQEEGAAVETLLAARLVFRDIRRALEALLHPLRLTASLRS